jgi:sphinganine-1-phosphate aldolase
VASELAAVHEELSFKLAPKTFPAEYGITRVKTLPEHGRDRAWLEGQWKGLKRLEKSDVQDGRVSGAVYHVSHMETSCESSDPLEFNRSCYFRTI